MAQLFSSLLSQLDWSQLFMSLVAVVPARGVMEYLHLRRRGRGTGWCGGGGGGEADSRSVCPETSNSVDVCVRQWCDMATRGALDTFLWLLVNLLCEWRFAIRTIYFNILNITISKSVLRKKNYSVNKKKYIYTILVFN